VKINLHIGQIVVEGTSLTRREREHLTTALEHELARQLREHVTRERGQPAARPRPDRDVSNVSRLGSRIAQDVLAVLPAGVLADSRPAAPSRRQSRRGRP
jgi:hypothetical protein